MNVQTDALKSLIAALLDCWPAHADYIEKSFRNRTAEEMAVSEQVAFRVLRLAQDMPDGVHRYCEDYRFLCERILLPEEFHFRRHGRYRLSSFAEAMQECYANASFMARYMNGLLISNVMWHNHASAISSYVRSYLPSIAGGDLLEIGPGHGLLLSFAASSANIRSAAGWDISPASLERTRGMLDALGQVGVELVQRNVFETATESGGGRFDAIVMSEILEHTEDPVGALQSAMNWLRPGGTIWINVPANSPAPDHIFLVESPEHAADIVCAAGLEITASHTFPMTGSTLENARRNMLTVSCVVVGRKIATV